MSKKQKANYPKSNVFTENDKKIFRYFDGKKTRGIDPLDVSIALAKQDFDWEETALRAKLGKVEAVGEMVEYTRKVFKLPEYEEDEEGNSVGLTSQDVMNTLADFTTYLDTLKKNTNETATSTPSTVVPPQ